MVNQMVGFVSCV